jgi:hypothetical protein
MERICIHCRALLAEETVTDWCPACGGALIERANLSSGALPASHLLEAVDRRGIVLPRRHAVGGIIAPQ